MAIDPIELSEETKELIEASVRNMVEAITAEILATVQVAGQSIRTHLCDHTESVSQQMKAVTHKELERI